MSQRQQGGRDRGDRDRDRGDRDRDRERDRYQERGSRQAGPVVSPRTNEYFLPGEGIHREVITADICRYLGNDAVVRPGVYVDPMNGVKIEGYFYRAYREFTSEMRADLKADSKRWQAELEQSSPRDTQNVQEYRASTVHHSRQYYGPSETPPGGPPSYATPTSNNSPVVGGSYDPRSPQFVQQAQHQYAGNGVSAYPSPASSTFTSPAQGVGHFRDNHYYVAAADYQTEHPAPSREMIQSNPGSSRTPVQSVGFSPPVPVYQTSYESGYYPNQPNPSMQGYAQATDPYYGRASVQGASAEFRGDPYAGRGHVEPGPSYVVNAMTPPTSTSSTSKRSRDEESHSGRHGRHHR